MKSLYGLVGYPLGHSFSAGYFAEKFSDEGISAEYVNFPIADIGEFPDIINRNPRLRGLNVTIPYKEKVIAFLDDLAPAARRIGAVNVVSVDRTGGKARLVGHNADVVGFVESLRPLLRPWHDKALVLGTGGASKAVVDGLSQLGIRPQYVSRGVGAGILSYNDITPEVMEDYMLVVNCTPLGMFPNTAAAPDILYDNLTDRHLLYDLVYNPGETLFLQKGRERGAAVKNGLEMLHIQAEVSWRIWNGKC